jgi:DNA polymerase
MRKCFADTETFSPVPINYGTHAYAEQAEVILFTYAFDSGPPLCWDVLAGEPIPDDLYEAAHDPATLFIFHNGGMFDRTVARHALPWFYEAVPLERWYDTMIQALAHSLPGSLDRLCEIFRLSQDERKLKTGKALIQLFCKPPAKNLKRGRATNISHPVEWQQFREYALADIPSMRAVHKKMPTWNYCGSELDLWRLDQVINSRGVCVDLDLATAAIEATTKEKSRLKTVTQEMTGYDKETGEGVESTTKRDKLLVYLLEAYGVVLPDLKKDTLERRVDDPDLPIELRDLLAVRLMASTASTAKYNALVRGVSSDGRLRGLLQFCGASRTGRWAGRTFQPQNLSRVPKYLKKEWEQAAEAIKVGAVDLVYDNPMEVLGSLVRGVIVAPPGKKLVVGDLSNIEGRFAAWLAGETWKLDKFREYDTIVGYDEKGEPIRKGPDLYKVAYAAAFNISVEEVDEYLRQIGKVMELMLQFEGGVGAFLTGAATYGIDLDEMAAAAKPTIPLGVWKESSEFYDWTVKQRRSTFGLARDVFIACDALKRMWRYAHPGISNTWPALKAAAIEAINNPGVWFDHGTFWRNGDNVTVQIKTPFRRDGAWLKCRLPSGRLLCYPSPQVDDKGQISYMGMHQYTRRWTRIKTYGGKLFENITQAGARDVLAHGMVLSENNGYEVVLSVHDELITETPDTEDYSTEGLCDLMATVPDWAEGIPLSSAGFSGYRYKKD